MSRTRSVRVGALAAGALLAAGVLAAVGSQAVPAALAPVAGQEEAGPRDAVGDPVLPGGAARLDGDQTAAVRDAVVDSGARNVILLIGDGMADSELTIARNYEHGAAGSLPGLDALPLTGQYTTYALDRETKRPDYVPDSAATATAWATGTKTYNDGLGIDVGGAPQPSILELAKQAGKRTGNVSTAELQDATPAAQFAKISDRGCYGPDETRADCPEAALENGGPGSITEQMLAVGADVTLGGGAESFAQVPQAGDYAGRPLLAQATERGYTLPRTAAELAAVTEQRPAGPVLGLFADGNMPVRWTGPLATPTGGAEPAARCTPNPERTADVPDLATMTRSAIDLLDGDAGFFLQVEGASIDKENHGANPCGQIGETVDLDEATSVALDFAQKAGDTLVVVTADHAHTSQITYPGENTTGLTRTLTTADDAPMTVAYGTAEAEDSQAHTGAQLRVAASGPGAANVVGLTDQTDLFATMADALGLRRD